MNTTTATETTIHGEFTTRDLSTRGRGSRIPTATGYVVFVGTTPDGRDWLVYSDDIESCPDIVDDYCAEFDRQNPR